MVAITGHGLLMSCGVAVFVCSRQRLSRKSDSESPRTISNEETQHCPYDYGGKSLTRFPGFSVPLESPVIMHQLHGRFGVEKTDPP